MEDPTSASLLVIKMVSYWMVLNYPKTLCELEEST